MSDAETIEDMKAAPPDAPAPRPSQSASSQPLVDTPERHDLFALMRRLERMRPDLPRIGDSPSRRRDVVALGQDPFLAFPDANVHLASLDADGRARLMVRFLGFLGPQGALPLATTEETYHWTLAQDDAFPRFLDVLNNRFLQLFYRAWADARPIAQHDRPDDDRFYTYLGALVGIGTPQAPTPDTVPYMSKLGHAGLLAPRVRSAARLTSFLEGAFGIRTHIDQFVALRLPLDASEQTRLGAAQSTLGRDMVVGSTVLSFEDKFRVRIHADSLAEYEAYLPGGTRAAQLADAVFTYVGDEYDWDVELALRSDAVPAARLGQSGRLGWTGWMAPGAGSPDDYRTDARFTPARGRIAA